MPKDRLMEGVLEEAGLGRAVRSRLVIAAAVGAAVILVGALVALQGHDDPSSRVSTEAGRDQPLLVDPPAFDPTTTEAPKVTTTSVMAPPAKPKVVLPRPPASTAAPRPTTTVAAVQGSTITSDGLYAVAADGSGVHQVVGGMTSGYDASPDSQRVAFSQDGELWVIRADGTGRTKIVPKQSSFLVCCGVSWSPSGEVIAFIASNGGPSERVWSVRPDGSELTVVAEYSASSTPLAWSHRGDRLAFVGRGLVVYEVASRTSRTLVDQPISPVVTWSPDDRRLAFMGGSQGAMYDVINADGTGHRTIPGTDKITSSLQWAPAGDQLLYMDIYRFELWAVGVDSGNPHKVLDACEGAMWSPASGGLAVFLRDGYVNNNGGWRVNLSVTDAEGRGARKLAQPKDFVHFGGLRWTPDGRTVLARTIKQSSP